MEPFPQHQTRTDATCQSGCPEPRRQLWAFGTVAGTGEKTPVCIRSRVCFEASPEQLDGLLVITAILEEARKQFAQLG